MIRALDFQSATPLLGGMKASGSRSARARRLRAALMLLFAGAASACSEMRYSLAEASGDRGICAPIPPLRPEPAANAYQQAIQRDECIHRWSYRFAGASDAADSVVGAVIGACRAQIDRSATLLGEGDADAERYYLAEMERVSRERALYRIIQARAGRCG